MSDRLINDSVTCAFLWLIGQQRLLLVVFEENQFEHLDAEFHHSSFEKCTFTKLLVVIAPSEFIFGKT